MPELAIPLAGLAVIAIVAGGATALRLHHSLPTVIALSGGIVVAVALLEVLPEAIESVGDAHDVVPYVALGFLGFFLLERVLVLHHRDDPDEARSHGRVGVLGAAGLSLHTFTDGVGIGLAFSVNTETGLLVLLAVVGAASGVGMAAALLPPTVAAFPMALPRAAEIQMDFRVLGIALSVSLVVGVLLGLPSVVRSRRLDPNAVLRDGGRGSAGGVGTPSRRLRVESVGMRMGLPAVRA